MFDSIIVYGFGTPNKHIITNDGKPLLVVSSEQKASLCLQYLEGLIDEEKVLNEMSGDKKAVGILKKVKSHSNNDIIGERYTLSLAGYKHDGKLIGDLKVFNLNTDELKDLALLLSEYVSKRSRGEKYGTEIHEKCISDFIDDRVKANK